MPDTPSKPAADRLLREFEAQFDAVWAQYDQAHRDAVKKDLNARGIDPDSLSSEDEEYYFG